MSGWDITALYGTMRTSDLDDQLRPTKVRFLSCGSFRCYEPIDSFPAVQAADLIIMPFDLRLVNIYQLLFRRPGKWPRVGLWGHGYGRSSVARPLRNILANRVDALIFYSERRRAKFQKLWGGSREKLFVAPNSLVVPNHGPATSPLRDWLIYVGRVQHRKRLDLGIAAIRLLKDNGKLVRLLIVGDGESTNLRDYAASLDVAELVEFRSGTYVAADLRTPFHGALAYLSPGHVGLGAVHAVSYGIPVIAAKDANHAPEVDHLLESESLFSCDLTAAGVAAAIERVMALDQRAVADRCYRRYMETCTIDHMVTGFMTACSYAVS